jgi:putative isomerase
VATPEQAQRVAKTLADTTHFSTYVPFPTVDYSHPGFDPSRGYWRGPVWVDQVYFAIQGLRNYGYSQQADELQQAFLNHAEGIFTNAPLRENYHPLTGAGLNAKHFSWTAAHILMMLHEQ